MTQFKEKIKIMAPIAILSAAIVVFGFGILSADNSIDGIDKNDDSESQKKIEDLEQKAKVYRDIIEVKQKQQESLNNQISLMNANIYKVETEIEINKRKIEELNTKINRKENEIRDKEETILSQKKILGDLLKIFYQYQQQNVLAVLLSNETFEPFMSEKDKLAQTGSKIREILSSVKTMKDKLGEEKTELEKNKNELTELHLDLKEKNSYLESNKSQKSNLLYQTKGEEEKYQKLLAKTREQIQDEIEKIELGKSGTDLGPLPPSKSGLLAYPVNPVVVTQGYGKTSFSNNYASGKHNGIDFGINYGSIYAADSGKVIQTGDNGKYAYGKWIAIDHGNGLVTLYGHLSKQVAGKGDKVKTGEVIGISGNTGFSTGPHLHFTVFAEKTFELVESKVVSGLMLPIGVSLNPNKYL